MQAIPIYIINLKRNPERKLFIQRQLDALKLDYQFVEAIDKYDLESRQCRTRIARSLGIDETNLEYKYSGFVRTSKINKEYELQGLGHLACLLSHIKTYNLILKNNDNTACILEDDAYLLPTFSTVLRAAPKFSWDILMFASHSRTIRRSLEKFNDIHRRIIKSYKYIVLIKCRSRKTSNMHNCITNLLNYPPHLYPNQSKSIMKILEEYRDRYKNMLEAYPPRRYLVWHLISNKSGAVKLYKDISRYTACRLGGLPSQHNRQTIDESHCIVEPAEEPTSGAAYALNQSTVKKWRAVAVSCNLLPIDSIQWYLHTNRQAHLRLISPPCVINSYSYQKYSMSQRYWHLQRPNTI